MRRAGSGWSARERAARWSPAIQPSVRWERVARSPGARVARPMGRGEEGGRLLGVKRRSAARSSSSWLRARRRAREGRDRGGWRGGGGGWGEVVEEPGEELVDGGEAAAW